MSKETGGPAFATDSASQVGPQTWHFEGMTLRDYFASSIASGTISQGGNVVDAGQFAKFVYSIADAMIAERSK